MSLGFWCDNFENHEFKSYNYAAKLEQQSLSSKARAAKLEQQSSSSKARAANLEQSSKETFGHKEVRQRSSKYFKNWTVQRRRSRRKWELEFVRGHSASQRIKNITSLNLFSNNLSSVEPWSIGNPGQKPLFWGIRGHEIPTIYLSLFPPHLPMNRYLARFSDVMTSHLGK